MTSDDFKYFINKIDAEITARNAEVKYRYYLDRAPWHYSGQIRESEVGKKLFYNLPSFPQLNFIENSFCYLRNLWRSRPLFPELQQEIDYFISICRKNYEIGNFFGYTMNFVRFLSKMAAIHLESEKVDKGEYEDYTIGSYLPD